jgi:hypothetical protein
VTEGTLFELPPPREPAPPPPTRPEEARLLRPVRQQLQWAPRDLEAVVPEEHPARAIWTLLENLDLSAFYGSIKAVLEGPGRPTTDPQVLLALWLLATVEGVGPDLGRGWPVCARSMMPTVGCAAGCPSTIICCRTSG